MEIIGQISKAEAFGLLDRHKILPTDERPRFNTRC